MFNWPEDILIIFTSGLRSKTSGREGKHAHLSGSSRKKKKKLEHSLADNQQIHLVHLILLPIPHGEAKFQAQWSAPHLTQLFGE